MTSTTATVRRIAYPGTFNPPTIAHVAIVEAVIAAYTPEHLALIVSRRPLLKEQVDRPSFEHRIEVITKSFAYLHEVAVVITDHQLIVDLARGYDAVVMGADKWRQVNDSSFYASAADRDLAVDQLPEVILIGRGDDPVPNEARLHVDPAIDSISSSRARAGERTLMTDAARDFDTRTGAWSAPDRYSHEL